MKCTICHKNAQVYGLFCSKKCIDDYYDELDKKAKRDWYIRFGIGIVAGLGLLWFYSWLL